MLYVVTLNVFNAKQIVGFSNSQYLAMECAKQFNSTKEKYLVPATINIVPYRSMTDIKKKFDDDVLNPLSGFEITTVSSKDETMTGIATKHKLMSFCDYYSVRRYPKLITKWNCIVKLLYYTLFGAMKQRDVLEPIRKLACLNIDENIDLIKYDLKTHESGYIGRIQ